MNRITQVFATATVATLGFAATTAAHAQQASYDYPVPATSAITRAQVQAELAEAKRTGLARVWSTSYNHMAVAKGLKSRAEVQAEVRSADRAALAAMTGEDSGSFALSRPPVRQAAAVLAAR